MKLKDILSLWCVQEQLGEIPLIISLTLTVFELYIYITYFCWSKESVLNQSVFTQVSEALLEEKLCGSLPPLENTE